MYLWDGLGLRLGLDLIYWCHELNEGPVGVIDQCISVHQHSVADGLLLLIVNT